jgi:hypothetical protein
LTPDALITEPALIAGVILTGIAVAAGLLGWAIDFLIITIRKDGQ